MKLSNDIVNDIKSTYRGKDTLGTIMLYDWLELFIEVKPQTISVFKNESAYYRVKHNRIIDANDEPTIICL